MQEIVYSLNVDDLVAFQIFHLRAKAKPFYSRLILIVGALAFLTVGTIESLRRGSPNSLVGALTIGILFAILFLPRHSKRAIKRAAKRSLKNPADAKKFCAKTWLSIDSHGVSRDCAWGNAFTRWEAFDRIEATDDHVFMYMNTESAYIVPRRAFLDDEDFRSFIHTVEDYWDGEPARSSTQFRSGRMRSDG